MKERILSIFDDNSFYEEELSLSLLRNKEEEDYLKFFCRTWFRHSYGGYAHVSDETINFRPLGDGNVKTTYFLSGSNELPSSLYIPERMFAHLPSWEERSKNLLFNPVIGNEIYYHYGNFNYYFSFPLMGSGKVRIENEKGKEIISFPLDKESAYPKHCWICLYVEKFISRFLS